MFAKNTAVTGFTFGLTSATSGAALTGATVTAKISKDGGALATIAAAVSELSLGLYKVDLSATEMNAEIVCLQFTATGAVPERFTIKTSTYTAALATRLSTALPNVAPGSLGGLPTCDDQNNLIGGINGNVAGDVVGRVLGAGSSSFVDYGVVAVQAINETLLPSQSQLAGLDAKLGGLSGAGNNTVLGMFQALASSDALAPADLGGSYDPADHALQSIKSGLSSVRLSATGLDSIPTTAPAGVAETFREMIVQTWRRFFRKSTLSGTQLKTYGDDGATVLTTQSVSDDSTLQTQGTST